MSTAAIISTRGHELEFWKSGKYTAIRMLQVIKLASYLGGEETLGEIAQVLDRAEF